MVAIFIVAYLLYTQSDSKTDAFVNQLQSLQVQQYQIITTHLAPAPQVLVAE